MTYTAKVSSVSTGENHHRNLFDSPTDILGEVIGRVDRGFIYLSVSPKPNPIKVCPVLSL